MKTRALTSIIVIFLILAASMSFAADKRIAPTKVKTGEARIALVIGNSNYAVSPLKNPVNDARSVAAALKGLGFDVVLKENQTLDGLRKSVKEFGDKLRTGGVGLFYYSGHGMQVKGENYLIPVDAEIGGEEEVEYNALNMGGLLAKMSVAKNRMNIVILDACRNNPFARSFRSTNSGLASMNAPVGTIVAYSTAPGSVASDGEGQGNGLYTGELVKELKKPGVKIEDMFKKVRAGVNEKSNGAQIPWESSSLQGDFYFNGGKIAQIQVRPEPEPAVDEETPTQVVVDDSVSAEEAKLLEELKEIERKKKLHENDLQTEEENRKKRLRLAELKAKVEEEKRRLETGNIVNPKDGSELVFVPAGEFWMGSPEGEGNADEHPRHRVSISGFYMGKYEVTNEQFKRFVDATGFRTDAEKVGNAYCLKSRGGDWGTFNGADWRHPIYPDDDISGKMDHPVAQVSWDDAKAYCDWAGLRLPTEAEWEYAARGGTETKYIWGDGKDGACTYANVADATFKSVQPNANWDMFDCSDGFVYTAPVGSFKANGFGLYDTIGSVWEWCSDYYGKDYYASSPSYNPQGPSSGDMRPIRGGSWFYNVDNFRSAARLSGAQAGMSLNVGFRVSKSR